MLLHVVVVVVVVVVAAVVVVDVVVVGVVLVDLVGKRRQFFRGCRHRGRCLHRHPKQIQFLFSLVSRRCRGDERGISPL